MPLALGGSLWLRSHRGNVEMKLSTVEANSFYEAWFPLLRWVNVQRDVVKVATDRTLTAEQAMPIRDVLWKDDALRHEFVRANPASLSTSQLKLIESWDHRCAGTFVIYRHYKKHSVLIHDSDAFAVLGLHSTLEEIVPMQAPSIVHAVLLPFGDRIVIDSLFVSENIFLGPGIRRNLLDQYRDISERGALRTSLLPSGDSRPSPETRAAINKKVLQAFERHLRRTRLSLKVVQRNLEAIGTLEAATSEGRTLRDANSADIERALHAVEPVDLKRFIQFLQATERMDYGQAQSIVDRLRR